MNARSFLNFWKSRMGVLLIFAVGLFFALLISQRFLGSGKQQAQTSEHSGPTTQPVSYNNNPVKTDKEKAAEEFQRSTVAMRGGRQFPPLSPNQQKQLATTLPPKPLPVATPPPPPPRPRTESIKIYSAVAPPPVAPIVSRDERNSRVAQRPPVRSISEKYAPYGRLVKCELVNTIDSSRQETPIIGLVTEDVWWDNHLIIPAGSEMHGSVATSKQNIDRIASTDQWVAVLPTRADLPHGAEMTLRGVALDMSDVSGDRNGWGITDGSFGMQGYTIKTMDNKEVQLFISTFLSEAAQALSTRQGSPFGGSILESTPQNAALNGSSAVLNQYAKTITDEIKEKGSYTRVPAGKQFYLYIRQTVDLADARVGDSDVARLAEQERAAEAAKRESLGSQQFFSPELSNVPSRSVHQGNNPYVQSFVSPQGNAAPQNQHYYPQPQSR